MYKLTVRDAADPLSPKNGVWGSYNCPKSELERHERSMNAEMLHVRMYCPKIYDTMGVVYNVHYDSSNSRSDGSPNYRWVIEIYDQGATEPKYKIQYQANKEVGEDGYHDLFEKIKKGWEHPIKKSTDSWEHLRYLGAEDKTIETTATLTIKKLVDMVRANKKDIFVAGGPVWDHWNCKIAELPKKGKILYNYLDKIFLLKLFNNDLNINFAHYKKYNKNENDADETDTIYLRKNGNIVYRLDIKHYKSLYDDRTYFNFLEFDDFGKRTIAGGDNIDTVLEGLKETFAIKFQMKNTALSVIDNISKNLLTKDVTIKNLELLRDIISLSTVSYDWYSESRNQFPQNTLKKYSDKALGYIEKTMEKINKNEPYKSYSYELGKIRDWINKIHQYIDEYKF